MDLKDSIQPHQLRKSLEDSPVQKDKKADVEKVAGIVSSIQGITLKILLAKAATGELRIDFGQSVAPLAKNAKPLVLEALDKFQAQLDELESWNVSLDGDSIVLVHYCPTNNQPRMKATPGTGEVKELAFEFQGAGNLPSEATGHQHKLVIQFEDADHITETWTWRSKGKDTPMVFHFARKKN